MAILIVKENTLYLYKDPIERRGNIKTDIVIHNFRYNIPSNTDYFTKEGLQLENTTYAFVGAGPVSFLEGFFSFVKSLFSKGSKETNHSVWKKINNYLEVSAKHAVEGFNIFLFKNSEISVYYNNVSNKRLEVKNIEPLFGTIISDTLSIENTDFIKGLKTGDRNPIIQLLTYLKVSETYGGTIEVWKDASIAKKAVLKQVSVFTETDKETIDQILLDSNKPDFNINTLPRFTANDFAGSQYFLDEAVYDLFKKENNA